MVKNPSLLDNSIEYIKLAKNAKKVKNGENGEKLAYQNPLLFGGRNYSNSPLYGSLYLYHTKYQVN